MWTCPNGHKNELPPMIWGIKELICKACLVEKFTKGVK